MITLGIAVILFLLWYGISRQYLATGSLVVGVLCGLVFATTSVGAPLGQAVQTSATAIGQSLQNAFAEVVK